MLNILDKINSPRDLEPLSLLELQELSHEIRQFILEKVSSSGGHLGSNLGVVELTVALHKVFRSPKDRLIWDIGHQSYAHKIITGRKEGFALLRQAGGVSGFTRLAESPHDHFGAGHSSTAISAALGMYLADVALHGEPVGHTLPIVGDASIVSGMALEALNHSGSLKLPKFTVILNDNNKSILEAVGAVSSYLSKLTSSYSYSFIRERSKLIVDNLPLGVGKIISQLEKYARQFTSGNFFDDLGFYYIGPIDGHNLEDLITVLENIKHNSCNTKPVLLHVITKKGKGFAPAEMAYDNYHGVGKFSVVDGKKDAYSSDATYTHVFGEWMRDAARAQEGLEAEKIVAISAGTVSGVGLLPLAAVAPKQLIDVGIAEQHAVTMAAGMAKVGLKPYVCLYSTFAQRAYDQIVHDVVLQGLPVRFVLDRAGFVGPDGATHHGLLNFNMYLPLPQIIYMCPFTQEDTVEMLNLSKNLNEQPSFIQYSKDTALTEAQLQNILLDKTSQEAEPLRASLTPEQLKTAHAWSAPKVKFGQGRILQVGNSAVAVLALGDALTEVLTANNLILNQVGKSLTIADLRFAKPLDRKLINFIASTHEHIWVLEHGYGEALFSAILNTLGDAKPALLERFHSISAEQKYYEHNTVEAQKDEAGVSSQQIYKKIIACIELKKIA